MNDNIFSEDFEFLTEDEIEQYKKIEIASKEKALRIAQEEEAI